MEEISSIKPSSEFDAIYSLRITQPRRTTAYRDWDWDWDYIRLLTVSPNHDRT